MRYKNFLPITVLVILFCGCTGSKSTEKGNESNKARNDQSTPNILLIIADDLGSDAFSSYNIGKENPNMPTLENLAESGIRFNNFWAYPTCTPTRASVITGKHAFRTKVQKVGDELSTSETTIHKFIDEKSNDIYNAAVIGKWHLSKNEDHPAEVGVKHFKGLIGGGVRNYNRWKYTNNGNTTVLQNYITTHLTDLAINWIGEQKKPWFLWLAYNAPHTPFHLPPSDLHSYSDLENDELEIKKHPQPYYFSMIEALDKEIGRLLDNIPVTEKENTIIIFMGDNGSPNQVVQTYGKRKAKGSIYQGGINVPLIITGAKVDRVNEVENALINSTDIFATIAELAGTGVSEIHDSKSLVPLLSKKGLTHKNYIYSEASQKKQSGYTIRNSTHKYIRFTDGEEELYDLLKDPYEKNNLANDVSLAGIKSELEQAATNIQNSR
ncbi:MAG: sulfatase-like hydrolase/transferase [Bacteroidota bacterium]